MLERINWASHLNDTSFRHLYLNLFIFSQHLTIHLIDGTYIFKNVIFFSIFKLKTNNEKIFKFRFIALNFIIMFGIQFFEIFRFISTTRYNRNEWSLFGVSQWRVNISRGLRQNYIFWILGHFILFFLFKTCFSIVWTIQNLCNAYIRVYSVYSIMNQH